MKNESGERHLRQLVKQKEESMVGHDVLKLEVKRLRESLNAKADEVFGLQNRKFQLQVRRDRGSHSISASCTQDGEHSSAADYFPEPSLNLP